MTLRSFFDLSISRKLVILFTAVSGTSLALFAGAIWIFQAETYKQSLRVEMGTLAETMADNAAAALAFHDDRSAAEALRILRGEPRAIASCLYRAGGLLAAQFQREGTGVSCPSRPGLDRVVMTNTSLEVTRTAALKGEPVGQLWIKIDLRDLDRQLKRLALTCLAALLASLIFAALAAAWLQRLISGPIRSLAAVASRVSLEGDYSIRARRTSHDEFGQLVDNFNEMMSLIHQRDLALDRAQSQLEARVLDRTRALQEEVLVRRQVEQDLFNAKELAEESNRAKSAFLANMSHELRTPLNAVIGYSELLEEDALAENNESAVHDLRCIKTAGYHLLQLIGDVLDLSKIEAGRMDIHLAPASVRDLVEEVTSTVQPLARKNHNEFVTNLPNDDLVVSVDTVRFRQSLLNLLSNACKFTENGTVSLNVIHEQAELGNIVCFEVRDTGTGISAADKGKLFRAFSQIDSSATRKHDGTGLGLAISQRFCQMMGGEITVESEPGVGSSFTIRIPEASQETYSCG